MFREVLRSTLYSSRRPFSSNATRRSSFSTLITNLLPVLGPPRPKIRLTFSIISREIGCDHERSVEGFGLPGSDQIVSSSAHRPLFRRWRGCWRRLRADAKKSFKKAELARRRRSHDHGARRFFHFAGRVRFWFY